MPTEKGEEETVEENSWVREFGGAVMVCDRQGIITGMNERAAVTYAEDGGRALIGRSLLDCHPEPSRTKLLGLLQSRQPNAYTIEKNGVKKLIYQAPWFERGEFRGLVELSLVIPAEMPHFVRGSEP